MRPGLDGTSSLYPLSSIWCECRGLARKTLVLILRSALVARLHSYSDPSEDHPRRNCWHLKISAGAHMGAYYQLAGADTEFLNVGTLPHTKTVQSACSGDVCDTEHNSKRRG